MVDADGVSLYRVTESSLTLYEYEYENSPANTLLGTMSWWMLC